MIKSLNKMSIEETHLNIIKGEHTVQNSEKKLRLRNQKLTTLTGVQSMQTDRKSMDRLVSRGARAAIWRHEQQVSLPHLHATSPKTILFPWLYILCSSSNLITYLNSQAKLPLGKGWGQEHSDLWKGKIFRKHWKTLTVKQLQKSGTQKSLSPHCCFFSYSIQNYYWFPNQLLALGSNL